ncbi:MAG: hypothetical protein KAV99_08325 [Candidatus Latescibacteria bacterium]|nr:hypothetical protein [Candidatus Latescibacterota bacterium]
MNTCLITARDGTMLFAGVYRTDAEGKFPSLLANRRSSEPIRMEVAGKGVPFRDNFRLAERSVG